ncbi:MAG: hypothetical protein NT053_06230 [Cyanobacteria bacterium]|nr:hypothetical protein [Cyanobacteriota bacterium]
MILPPEFASVNLSSAAMSYYKPADGNEWLAIGAHGLLLRTKEPAASPRRPKGACCHDLSGGLPGVPRRQLEMDQQGTRRGRHAPRRVLSGPCRLGECPARHSNSVANSAGLAYIDSTITGASSIGAILLIAQDTTPG